MASKPTTSSTTQHVRRSQLRTAPCGSSKSPSVKTTTTPLRATSAPKKQNTVSNDKPSKRLNPKTADPFNKKTSKSSIFASAYSNGAIPCRLQHGSVRHKLQWTTPPEDLNYDPTIILFAEGLQETIHPYAFVASEGFIQLLSVEDAEEKVEPVLQKIITPIKKALEKDTSQDVDVKNQMSSDETCFQKTLTALVKLSDVTGTLLNPHLKNLLPQISRKLSSNKTTKETILRALQSIESNGGGECTSIIKSRIPTYSSVFKAAQASQKYEEQLLEKTPLDDF